MTAVLLTDRTAALERDRTPFVRATVVRAERPTSARPGDSAIVLPDGTMEGFVGGGCAESSVRQAALDALRGGRSLLLRVLPPGAPEFPDAEGARQVVNHCLSGGSLEIFLEPRLPAPVLRVAGSSPVAEALAVLAPGAGMEVLRDGDADPAGGPADAVVVAALNHGDEDLVRAALDGGAPYVGLVASPRRGTGVLASLGLTAEEAARVKTPAGLDIGARTAGEIAVSILAEIVQRSRRGPVAPAGPPDPGARRSLL